MKSKEIEITPNILRQMQMIQLEMLVEVDRICRKYDIPYSIDGGTLLGAVRHKGFIPWDDDIDIIMLRADYEKFYLLSQKELDTERFFLQEERTDTYYYVGYPRIRRKHTIYQRAGHENMRYVSGVFIDLFILDNVPDNKILRPLHRFACFILRKMLWANSGKYIHSNFFVRVLCGLASLVPRSVIFKCFHMLKNACNQTETKLVRHMTHPYPNTKTCPYGMPRAFLDTFVELEFEGLRFKAVKNYVEYLTMLYGDYMVVPPLEKRKPHIHLTAFSPVSKENV